MQVEGSDPLVGAVILPRLKPIYIDGAPDIDWKAEVKTMIKELSGQYFLQVTAMIKGKGFPAYELFITDNSMNHIFLHTYPAPNRLELANELLKNPFYDYSRMININIPINRDGTFLMSKDLSISENNDYRTYKIISINFWNSENLVKLAAPDCETGECGK